MKRDKLNKYLCREERKYMLVVNLYEDPPSGLHGHGDAGDDGVGEGEVEHEVVHVGPHGHVCPGCRLYTAIHDTDYTG